MDGRAACPPALCSVLARVLLHACSVASGVLRVLCVSQSSCQLSGEGLTCACAVEPLERDRQVRGWCASAKKMILFMAWAGRDTKFAVQNLMNNKLCTAYARPRGFFQIFNFMIMFINIIIYLLLLYFLT